MKKLWKKLKALLLEYIETQDREADAAREAEAAPQSSPQTPSAPTQGQSAASASTGTKWPLGLASCWNGTNASKRMMNVLSPKMSDSKFREYVEWMRGRGCDTAHVILANGGDGECAGYAAWRDADRAAMMARLKAIRAAGFAVVPWIITDDSAALLKELFGNPEQLVSKCAYFLDSAPYVVLGLEMDEGGGAANWAAVRTAVRRVYSGPLAVHHTSGNEFKFASLGDIIMGQLDPNCTEAQIKAQIKAIRAKGKRAVGFEYARGPSRKLALAALNAGAEGCGNWDGGAVPGAANDGQMPGTEKEAAPAKSEEDAVDFSLLDWCWGGFKGGGAQLDDKARIMGLRVTSSGLSYSWMSGGCENLGASSKEDAACLACLFCLVGGKWRGGKFDWISTSRLSRDFKNISEGYNGWDRQAVSKADKFAFVIVSRDGKKRTNVIVCGK